MVIEVHGMSGATGPTISSTVIREAFDFGFTLYFSDHSSISIAGTFEIRGVDGESRTLTASSADLIAHTSELVALIGMEVAAVNIVEGAASKIRFTSGIEFSVL